MFNVIALFMRGIKNVWSFSLEKSGSRKGYNQPKLKKSWWRTNCCSWNTTVQELGMLNEIGRR